MRACSQNNRLFLQKILPSVKSSPRIYLRTSGWYDEASSIYFILPNDQYLKLPVYPVLVPPLPMHMSRQIVDYDRRRNSNREALGAIKKNFDKGLHSSFQAHLRECMY